MDKPVVWIVDADHWPRAELRALLIERGYDAIGFESLVDAVLRAAAAGRGAAGGHRRGPGGAGRE